MNRQYNNQLRKGVFMYLHLGQNVIVRTRNIIGIFDMDTSTIRRATKDYLFTAEKDKKVKNVSFDLPKSFVVCREQGKTKVYISPLASSTLIKRHENNLARE